MKNERAFVALTLVVEEPEHADRAVTVCQPPLVRPGRIEREPADAEHPPDVDDRLWAFDRKLEEIGVADERLRRQPAVEGRCAEGLLDRAALWLGHLFQRQRRDRLPPRLAARGAAIGEGGEQARNRGTLGGLESRRRRGRCKEQANQGHETSRHTVRTHEESPLKNVRIGPQSPGPRSGKVFGLRGRFGPINSPTEILRVPSPPRLPPPRQSGCWPDCAGSLPSFPQAARGKSYPWPSSCVCR